VTLSRVLFSSDREDWPTPLDLFRRLDREFGPFDLDAAASPENALCTRYFTQRDDAFRQDWRPFQRIWINPPYGDAIPLWTRRARQEAERGAVVCMLLPSRTDTQWFHRDVLPYARVIRFIEGRITFRGAEDPAPFPSVVVVFGPAHLVALKRPKGVEGQVEE